MNAAGERGARLDTWERIMDRLALVADAKGEPEAVDILVELLVNLRLLGQDEAITDARTRSGDIEKTYAELERVTRSALDSIRDPSPRVIYFTREIIKRLPVRRDSEDMIEQIRMAAEAFEEERCEDDPLRGFAGDLRKEVHRRLSPRIIGAYLEPYLALVERGDPAPIVKAGYVALPSRFDPDEESRSFVDLAKDLMERLTYLWDYQVGDLAAVKESLRRNAPLFERCFLAAEVGGFLERLEPERLKEGHLVLEMLKRLASFKRVLKQSYDEGRIGLYDLVLVDLSFGRLIFLLANDLTNNHYVEVTPRNLRAALGVLRELLNISTIKGLAIGDVERRQREIDELRDATAYDFVKAKRCLGSISAELQRYLQADIIDRMSGPLNRVLEAYGVPTSRLSPIKTRFFNNFIRRTQIHVLSEFVEKVAGAVDRELERRSASMHLYAEYRPGPEHRKLDRSACVATTWGGADELARPFLGGKGNGLVDMAAMGLRVPEAFVLGYPLFSDAPHGKHGPGGEPRALALELLGELERRSGRALGDGEDPLLVSVRSGAPVSMPGVMLTILNVGLSPDAREALSRRHGRAFADSLYRRFLENAAAAVATAGGRAVPDGASETELEGYLRQALGDAFLLDPREQLLGCIGLVYASRASSAVDAFAKTLATSVGTETAVTVQRMVYGNLDQGSLSGVVITRDPITGADELFGEFKRVAQGEEVVMGSAFTEPIARLPASTAAGLEDAKRRLVSRYRQDLDLEFTVESGELFLLQTRAARLGAFAQLVADTDFLERGLIDAEEYRRRLDRLETANACVALPRADFRARRWNPPLCVGVPINGGVVSGTLVLSEERLEEAELRRESVVYFAHTTKPTDFAIMNGASAIVTVYPGRTSHAAITAMSINKPCIVGCGDAEIDLSGRRVVFRSAGGQAVPEGERVTVDGNTGAVYRGIAPISEFFLPVRCVALAAETGTAPDIAARVRGLVDERLAGLARETRLRRRGLGSEEDSLAGRRILVRVDANVYIDEGRVADPASVLRLAPTLEALLERGATPVACSHLGDPGRYQGKDRSREDLYEAFSLRPVAELLAEALGGRLAFHPVSVAASGLLIAPDELIPGVVNVLENLRFATGEKDNDEAFARALAELGGGLYLNDAFNVCDRRHASIVGAPRFCERRLAGPSVERELAALEAMLGEPARPFVAAFRGSEAATRLGAMAALLPRVDRLATAEASAAPEPGSAAAALVQSYPERLATDAPPVLLAEALSKAGTVLWVGPASAYGSLDAEACLAAAAARGARVVVCCDEYRYRLPSPASGIHYSSGPRAFLEYLERLSLPGVTALDQAP